MAAFLQRIRAGGLPQHRRRLLRHDARAHPARSREAVQGHCLRARCPKSEKKLRLSGLEPLNIGDDSLFVNVGERTNVTGSKAFARLILNGNYAEALTVARQQVENGAQIIDVNMDEAMLDSQGGDGHVPESGRLRAGHLTSAGDDRFLQMEVIEAGLKCVQGKSRRQLDQHERRRSGIPAPGAGWCAATAPPPWSWHSTRKARPTPWRAASRSARAPTTC